MNTRLLFVLVALISVAFTICTLFVKHKMSNKSKYTVMSVVITSVIYLAIYLTALALILISKGVFK